MPQMDPIFPGKGSFWASLEHRLRSPGVHQQHREGPWGPQMVSRGAKSRDYLDATPLTQKASLGPWGGCPPRWGWTRQKVQGALGVSLHIAPRTPSGVEAAVTGVHPFAQGPPGGGSHTSIQVREDCPGAQTRPSG